MPFKPLPHTLAIVIATLFIASSCGRGKRAKLPSTVPPLQARPVKIGDVERGLASWYGHPYHGRPAANGEIYDMNLMTAAHRTMPFGTWVKVDNETNGKTTQVRITDRGPFIANRIIDLSRKAAEEIALIGPGIAMVRLTVIPPPAGAVVERYGVQVAALEDRGRAQQLLGSLDGRFGSVRLVEAQGPPRVYRVIVGEGTREQAAALLSKLRQEGYRGFVTRHVP